MIKMQIRVDSISFAKQKRFKQKNQETFLEAKISELQKMIDKNETIHGMNETIEELEKLKQKLEQIIEYKTKGSIIRSKTRWFNEGEKNTKSFLNLEKRHCNKKTIKSLRTENGVTIGTDKDILQEAKNFYQKLYTSSKACPDLYDSTFYPKNNVKKLDDLQKESCEGTLKLKECLEALKSMDNNKSPGLDGLPAEFYKVFWQDIHTYLIDALNSEYKKGTLSISQRRGLNSLLPKKNKILYQLKNWRPISLLNCDYKIATKAIAVRMKTVLPSIINPDQTGFLKGRFIGENIRLIDGVIDYTEFKGIPGLLLFVDFEKAFDTLEWSFIVKTLHYYNFGPSFISWVKTFYSNASGTIQNNGWSSEFFPLSRGVRQGCPLSPYLLFYVQKYLAQLLEKNSRYEA